MPAKKPEPKQQKKKGKSIKEKRALKKAKKAER
jgi:hypothetical protein